MNRNIFINLLCLTMCLFSASQSYAQQKTLSKTAVSIKQQGYVDVQDEDPTIKVSLMYSRPDNFTGKILYKDLKEAFLHPQAAKALAKAQKELKRLRPDLSLIVFDAARPMSIQQQMWDGCFADRNGRLHWVQLFSDQEGDDTGIPTTSQPVVCIVESEARYLPSAVEAEELILEAGTAESIDATMPHVNPANEIFHSVLDLTYAASSDERVASVTLGENGRVTVEAHALGTAVLSLGMASTQGGQPLILRTVTVQVTGEEQVPILGLEEGTPQVGQLVIDNREVDTLRLTAQWTDGIPAQGSTLHLAHYDGQKLTAAYQGVFQDGQAVLPAVPAQALEGSYRLLILDGGLRPLAQPIGGS